MTLTTLDILTLLQLPRLGPAAVREAIVAMDELADGPPAARLPQLVEEVFRGRFSFKAQDYENAHAEAMRVFEACRESDVGIVTFADEHYPQRLRRIAQAPAVLYFRGNWKAMTDTRTIAVVGTRQPTPFGHERGVWAGETLAAEQFVVVSGLALGCDTAAHVGTLKGRGKTVAVLAHGLDTVSPASNRRLAAQIIEDGGALMSEYPPGSRAFPQNFVHRDRLQIGLAAGLLVIETDVQGGTMHTVGFCREQAKALACIGHPLEWRRFEKTRGNQSLIQQRLAYEIHSAEELVNFAHHAMDSEGTIGGLHRKLIH